MEAYGTMEGEGGEWGDFFKLDIKNPKKEGFLGFWGRFPSFFHFPPFFPLLAIENEKQPL